MPSFDSGTGNLNFSNVLASGDYSLRITNGGTPTETFSLNLDASNVAKPKPDVSVGLTATATTGVNVYSPAVQTALANSRRAATGDRLLPRRQRRSPRGHDADRRNRRKHPLRVAYNSSAGNVTAAVVAGTFTTASITEDGAPVSLSAQVTPNKRNKES